MKISTEIHSCTLLTGEEKAVEYTARAGFDAWDFSMFLMTKNIGGGLLEFNPDSPLAGSEYLKFARRYSSANGQRG